jgi:large subunit ribosomal protein L15
MGGGSITPPKTFHPPGRRPSTLSSFKQITKQPCHAMASNLSIRAVRTANVARSASRPLATLIPRRTYATSPEVPTAESKEPRWSYTPPRTKAPFSLHNHSKPVKFHVNSDPALLDAFYTRMLGQDGEKVLSDEVKWLAVTHKSFDQGRRGFNDRLAFLGT